LSPALPAVVLGRSDNQSRFPEFCFKSEKWFRRRENCFVAQGSTTQFQANIHDFNQLTISLNAPPKDRIPAGTTSDALLAAAW